VRIGLFVLPAIADMAPFIANAGPGVLLRVSDDRRCGLIAR